MRIAKMTKIFPKHQSNHRDHLQKENGMEMFYFLADAEEDCE